MGYYALLDYAVQYWFHHLRACIDLTKTSEPALLQDLIRSAKEFFISYGLPTKLGRYDDTTKHEVVTDALQGLPEDGNERNSYFNIEHRMTLIRKRIEVLQEQVTNITAQNILTNLHGTEVLYKCSKPWCEFFTVGFGSAEDRQRHVDSHDLPFCCSVEDCFAYQVGYDTQSKLEQHKKRHHPEPATELEFPRITSRKPASLWTAAARGDLATVKALLDSRKHIDRVKQENTLLHLAARSGHFDICKLLVERGASVDKQGSNEQTALHMAVLAGSVDIVRLFLSQDHCQPDIPDWYGKSPFFEACVLGHLDIVKLLLRTGKIQINRRHNNYDGASDHFTTTTPFGYACSEGHFAVVQYLLQQKPSGLVNMDIIREVAQKGHEAIVELLLPALPKTITMSELDINCLPPHLKKMRDDWSVVFNPRETRVVDVDLVRTFNHESMVWCVKFSYCGKYVATGCYKAAHIYDVGTGEKICVLPHADNLLGDCHVVCVSFNPDGTCLATGAEDKLVRVWDIAKQSIRKILSGHGQAIYSVDFAPNGDIIASGASDRTVQLWDVETGAALLTLSTEDRITTVAISPDSRLVAAGSLDQSIGIWDARQGYLLKHLNGSEGHDASIYSIAFSPDNKFIISGGMDKKLKMWEISDKESKAMNTFEGHKDFVLSVTMTSDAKWILSGSKDRGVQFWDPKTGSSQLLLRCHKNSVLSVATSPLGGLFATASGDLRARIWAYRYLS